MKIETIGYLPPPGIGYPESFLANLSAYKTEFPIVLYSDHTDWHLRFCENPARVKNRQFPHWISNFVFFMGLQYAIASKLDCFIYLEADVRVRGDNWDRRMMEEAMVEPRFVAAGSAVIYNISGSTHTSLKLATNYCYEVLRKTNIAVPIYGFRKGLSLYPNGAGAIYRTEVCERIFRGFQNDLMRSSCVPEAWDIQIGKSLYEMFGDEVFELMVPLACSYSGCGDELTTESERINMLTSGAKVLCHQVKGPWK